MKTSAISFYSRILSVLLVWLGFSACGKGDNGENGDFVMEYGVPSARYRVRGQVVSAEKGKEAVPNIQVVMIGYEPNKPEEIYFEGDTVKTDSNGGFSFDKVRFPYSHFKIKLQDVDGEANGAFDDKEVIIEFKKSDYKGGQGSWYDGEAHRDMNKIELTPAKVEPKEEKEQ